MAGDDEDYVYDEDSGEWLPASQLAAKQARVLHFDALHRATCWPMAMR